MAKTKNSRAADIFSMCAEDVMQCKLVTVGVSDTLAEAERTLAETQVSGAPVLDTNGRLLGVVSVRDLVRHRIEDQDLPAGVEVEVFDNEVDETETVAFERPGSGACVGDVMTQEIVSVTPTTPLPMVARRMVETRVHRVLVMRGEQLVGLVSSMDLLGAIAGAAQR